MEEEKQGAGPLVGIIIIVLILVLGGIYYAGKTETEEEVLPTAEEILMEEDTQIQELSDVGTSDEIDSIEEDLLDTVLDDLDSELEDIDAELEDLE
jgi:hypothetical protein